MAQNPQLARRKGGKRQRTRARLIAVAARLFREKGISATSLAEVAARAGMTKGAIYGNFRNKDALVFAVAVEATARPRPKFKPGLTLEAQARSVAAQAIAHTPSALKQLASLTEIDLYMLTHKGLMRRVQSFALARYQQMAADLVMLEAELPLPALQLAVVIHALVNGLTYQRAIVPKIVTNELVTRALALLLRR